MKQHSSTHVAGLCAVLPNARQATHKMPSMSEPLTPMYSRMHMRKPPAIPSHMVGLRICGAARRHGTVKYSVRSRATHKVISHP